MVSSRPQRAFTLIELLVVVSLIALLCSMLLPSLSAARNAAKATQCLANLHACGVAMAGYQSENADRFWPYALVNHPATGVRCYFWGTDADPVDPRPSPFMKHLDANLAHLWCPMLPWGSYIPQGSYVAEPTTTYGYNGRFLDPTLNGRSCRRSAEVRQPADLFVLADTAMAWAPGGVAILQNSTYLEPVNGNWTQLPTNHFRHGERTHALTADGRASAFGTEGWPISSKHRLGFVGTENFPHYEQ